MFLCPGHPGRGGILDGEIGLIPLPCPLGHCIFSIMSGSRPEQAGFSSAFPKVGYLPPTGQGLGTRIAEEGGGPPVSGDPAMPFAGPLWSLGPLGNGFMAWSLHGS